MNRFQLVAKNISTLLAGCGVLIVCTVFFAGQAAAATPLVAAGTAHGIILKGDGSAAVWGDNSAGQLGQGTQLYSPAPIQLTNVPAATAASAGTGHALILAQDGTVWAWGANNSGQLGDGTRTTRTMPVQVPGLSNIIQVAAGGGHSLALKADGTVWAWGQNTYGAIGDGTTVDRLSPVQVQGLANVTSISAGFTHSLALQNGGAVFAWGDNTLSQIDGQTHGIYVSPHGVGGLGIMAAIAANGTSSFAVATNGWVYWWGSMRNNSPGGTPGVSRITALSNIVAVSAGATASSHALFIDSSGLVYLYYDIGQSASTLIGQTPQTFNAVSGLHVGAVGAVAGGDYVDPNWAFAPPGGSFSTVLLADGTIASWGQNSFGQVGNGSGSPAPGPVAVAGLSNVVSVSNGDAFTLAVTSSGAVWVWGDNVYGELANGLSVQSTVAATIPSIAGATAIASGIAFNLALNANGTVVGWGDNTLGQTGSGSLFAKQSAPVQLPGLSGITAIAAGTTHGLAIDSNKTIWAWGDNSTGQLGSATTTTGINGAIVGLTAVQKSDFINAIGIAAGGGFSLALRSDGTVWTWGADITGQTGCTTFQPPCSVDPTVPRQVAKLSNIVQVAAGLDFALALRNDGTVFSFGSNTVGQLGSGFIIPVTQSLPAIVTGLPAIASIAAGGQAAFAQLADGTLWSWGGNALGQLGNGTTLNNPTPALMKLGGPVWGVAAGVQSGLAVVQLGPVLAWGDNSYGELGDGTYEMRTAPVVVLHEGGTGTLATNDWFLVPTPSLTSTVAPGLTPSLLVQAAAAGYDQARTVAATINFLAPDVGTSGSIYVMAMIPPGTLPVLNGTVSSLQLRSAPKQATSAITASSYEFVQLTPSGWQDIVNLQFTPYATGTLSGGFATQTIMAGIDTTQLPGAQFCIGYGMTAQTMLANQTLRSVYGVLNGPVGVNCIPPSASIVPQTGVWWNPAEGGRGYTIEYNGSNLFMAAYLYDVSGRSTWLGAGPSPMSGSTFTAPLTTYMNGQTLTGNYQIPVQGPSPGNISITFSDPTHGSLTWPGGTIPIERYEFVPNGLNLPPSPPLPQNGWWWNPSEGGRGYSIEVQGNTAFIASYMYDSNGNPIWYAAGPAALTGSLFQGEWLSYTGGQTLTGTYQLPSGDTPAGSLAIQFTSPTTGFLTLPNGRTIPIERYSF